MTSFDIVRAWKDEAFRRRLSATQLAELPENPAGVVELSDDQLAFASGGAPTCITPCTYTAPQNCGPSMTTTWAMSCDFSACPDASASGCCGP